MSLAVKYGMKKHSQMAKGGEVQKDGDCRACKGGVCYAHGGEVDIVDHAMRKRMSKGGRVANETKPMVDSEPAEYDDLVLQDDLESSYTGANSGDRLGNKHTEEQDHDIVAKVMRSRHKKDRNPRPA
jgi:hypothetical protein